MEREVNEEKRQKFIEYAGKRVNNVLHDIQILEPMARSNSYDFTRKDVEDMFTAMQETLNDAKDEFYKKFDEKAKAEKKVFSFAINNTTNSSETVNTVTNNAPVEQHVEPSVLASAIPDSKNAETNSETQTTSEQLDDEGATTETFEI